MQTNTIKAYLKEQKIGRACDWCDILDQRVLLFWHLGERWSKERIAHHLDQCLLLCQNCLRLALLQESLTEEHKTFPRWRYYRWRTNRAHIDTFKRTHGCARCGLRDHRVLDFHHRDPTQKSGGVSQHVSTWTLDKIKAEIAKCEVLCANCHFLEHLGKEEEVDIEEIVRRLKWEYPLGEE